MKSIEKTAEENSDDPFLVALSERAKAVQESFEDRQTSTEDALAALLKEIEKNEQRKKEQSAKGLDGLTYFVLCKLTDEDEATGLVEELGQAWNVPGDPAPETRPPMSAIREEREREERQRLER